MLTAHLGGNGGTVRAGKFIARKNWVVTGSDDMQLRVFNYNTHEKVAAFEAHSDYIRSIAIHPTQPFVLTSSDDMLIKLWDWDRGWKNIQVRRRVFGNVSALGPSFIVLSATPRLPGPPGV